MCEALRGAGKASALLLALAIASPARAWAGDLDSTLERLAAREAALSDQVGIARGAAARRAAELYRLSRGGETSFAVAPSERTERARNFDLALRALRRDAGEARQLGAELERVRGERETLAAAAAVSSSAPSPTLAALPPVAGPVVAHFGLARDPQTGVEMHRTEIQILSRASEPARTVAPGTVERVERAANGAWTVLIAHPGRWTSVVGGLREVRVAPGDAVEARAILGLVGRSPDGAPIVTVGLYRGRTPADPERTLYGRVTR